MTTLNSIVGCSTLVLSSCMVYLSTTCFALQSNAMLTQQLADNNHLLAALREEAAELAGQLTSAQASITAKDKLLEQLKGMIGTGDATGRPESSTECGCTELVLDGMPERGSCRMPAAAWSPVCARWTVTACAWAASTCSVQEGRSLYAVCLCWLAGRLSDADGGFDAQTGSSTPSTHSPSKHLSRQTSRSGLSNHLAVGQVRQFVAGKVVLLFEYVVAFGSCLVRKLIRSCVAPKRPFPLHTHAVMLTLVRVLCNLMRTLVMMTVRVHTVDADGVCLEGLWQAERHQDRGTHLPAGPGSCTAGGGKAGNGGAPTAAGRKHEQGKLQSAKHIYRQLAVLACICGLQL